MISHPETVTKFILVAANSHEQLKCCSLDGSSEGGGAAPDRGFTFRRVEGTRAIRGRSNCVDPRVLDACPAGAWGTPHPAKARPVSSAPKQ
jgi:hypothetical protein